jgi:hypothetical protein
MSLDFDFSSLPEDVSRIHDAGGNTRPTPGKGMAVIRGWDEYGGANGKAHKVTLEIAAWSTPADVGKTHEQLIFFTDTTGKGFPMRVMTCLAMAAGLFNAADVKRWKAEGVRPQVDMSKLVGRPVMIELIEEPDQRDPSKKYIRIGNIGLGYWHCTDNKTRDWPKDAKILNSAAAIIGQWDAPTPAHKPTQAPAAKPAASATADPFAF